MSAAPTSAAPRILVVEDDADLAFGLKNNLEIDGYEVEVVGDGDAAVARAAAWRPALILLDLMLPGLDGLRVLRAIRARDAETRVLVLTARGDESDKVRGLKLGADDYVTKPFGLLELLARVESLLRRAQRSAAPAAPTASDGDQVHGRGVDMPSAAGAGAGADADADAGLGVSASAGVEAAAGASARAGAGVGAGAGAGACTGAGAGAIAGASASPRATVAAAAAATVLRIGAIEVRPAARLVFRDGTGVPLRPKEFDLLVELFRHRGAVVSRVALMQAVWGYSSAVISRTIDTHIGELRRKLEPDAARPRHIVTVRGIGYRLDD